MFHHLIEVFEEAALITGFILTTMLIIEYLNVHTAESWQKRIKKNSLAQYFFAALLGLLPGCLGSYVIVALYTHRIITIGALVAAMTATSGDEAFVMLAMFPLKAVLIFAILFVVGFFAGYLTDKFFGKNYETREYDQFEVHHEEEKQEFSLTAFIKNWRKPGAFRLAIAAGYLGALALFATGVIGGHGGLWEKIGISIMVGAGLIIVAVANDHFLTDHLWKHVIKKHLLQIFLWCFGALVFVHLLSEHLDLEGIISRNILLVFGAALLVGLIPSSGPHLLFVTLFAKGLLPFSILLANSLAQNGHGPIPLLAHSRKDFAIVKGITFALGLLLGGIALALGF